MKKQTAFKRLSDRIKRYEELQQEFGYERERREQELAQLEQVRQRLYEKVANENTDGETREQLDEADQQLVAMQKEIREFQQESRRRLQETRGQILQFQENVLKELEQSLHADSEELRRLRQQAIPKAEQHLNYLQEEAQDKEAEISAIQKEMDCINQLQLDVLFED